MTDKQIKQLERCHLIAQKHGGKCLSNSYQNNKISLYLGALTKLRWQCELEHIWEAIPSSVIRGHWCRKCSSKKAGLKRRLKCQA